MDEDNAMLDEEGGEMDGRGLHAIAAASASFVHELEMATGQQAGVRATCVESANISRWIATCPAAKPHVDAGWVSCRAAVEDAPQPGWDVGLCVCSEEDAVV